MAAVDKTKIANRVLARVGSSRINDYNDPVAEQARKIRDVFPQCLEQMLGSAYWRSHLDQQDLAQLSATPNHKWAYQYQLPVDFIQAFEVNRLTVWDEKFADYFEEHGDRMLTNAETVYLTYVKNSTDVNLLTPSMVTALVFLVASEVAVPLRQDEAMAADLLERYERTYLPQAILNSAVKRKDRQWNPVAESRLVRARYQSTNG